MRTDIRYDTAVNLGTQGWGAPHRGYTLQVRNTQLVQDEPSLVLPGN